MIAYIFFFHTVYWSFILGQGWLLRMIFVKHVKTIFVQVHNAVRMHELLCCESSRKCQHKQCQLGQEQFEMFYKIDCCAAIHGRIWTMYQMKVELCYHVLKSVLFYLFSIWRHSESNRGFLFLNSHCIQGIQNNLTTLSVKRNITSSVTFTEIHCIKMTHIWTQIR